MTAPGPIRLEADWLVPVSAPPIANGAVLIGDDGRVLALGPALAVPSPPSVTTHRWPESILLPGLVNAHTHLELTGLEGQVEDDDFSAWIRGVRQLKADRNLQWFREAARQGVRDAFAAGITTVLDTGDSGTVLEALHDLGGSGVVYQEVFGPDPAQLAESMAGLEAKLMLQAAFCSDRTRLGVSPHAPYTVSGPLYRAVADLARERQYPIAVHLAESPAESEFVERDQGPFADAWRARGIPPLAAQRPNDPGARRSPVAWLDALGVLGPDTLAIHAIQLDAQDTAILAERGVAVAHCPVSNHRHHRAEAPLRQMLAANLRVGVGTDSVVSVGRLDLFAEMRSARALAGLSAEAALALGTERAAGLVGLEGVGRLCEGGWGDVIAVAGGPTRSPIETVLAASPDQVVATYAAGRLVHRKDPLA